MSVELVRLIKSELETKGFDLSGPCGAFEIVKRVAWAKRHEGYGLLGGKSPGQNGCTVGAERYSVDWILKPDGHGVDILRDAGGDNEPIWLEEEASASLYRPAIDPGDEDEPIDPPDPSPPSELAELKARLVALEQDVMRKGAAIESQRQQLVSLTEQVHMLADARPPVVELPPLIAEGTTSRDGWHSHSVRLTVKPA